MILYRKETMRSALNLTPRLILILFLTCTLGIGAAQASPTPKSADNTAAAPPVNLPSEAIVDSFMQQTFGYEPGVSWKISSIKPAPVPGLAQIEVILASPQGQQLSRFYVTADGEHAVVGEIIPFGAKPFDPAKKKLEKGITGPSRGPKDAPVTIVEFGDLQCPACKAAQPAIEALVAAEPNARFVFQSFPLEMHNWAAKGAAYADCVGRASNEAFWKFIGSVFSAQTDITAANADEKLTGFADSAGVKGADIAVCAAKPETASRVEKSVALGNAVNVDSTPTLFVNGRKIPGVPYEVLQKLVDFAAKEATPAGK